MPIYEYECKSCRHRFELRQGFDEIPEARCPLCDEIACRMFSPTPLIFKGSGFYITDHRKGTDTEISKPTTEPKAKEGPVTKADKKEPVTKADKKE